MSSNTSVGGSGSLAGKQSVTSSTKSKSETVNYLLLYEAMVRHQDSEFDATHDHIALTVGRIQYLGRKSKSAAGGGAPELVDEESAPKGMLTYLQMRRCLLRLGYAWNRSLPPNSNPSPQDASYYDDDVSVMSANSASTFISGGGTSNASGSNAATRDIIATDAQLIMLLTTLVEMEERHRAVRLAAAEEEEDTDEDDEPFGQGLFLPEFIQAYKLIIGGMQSLQTYPSPDEPNDALKKACLALGMPADKAALRELRVRSRERTLGLLRLFGPDSRLYKDDPALGLRGQQSAGESPTARNKTRDGLRGSQRGSAASNAAKSRGGREGRQAKDGLLPRLTEEEIRRMVHSKDTALAKILEEHETEMNVMATNMEELRLRGIQTQNLLKRRRKRTRTAAVVGLILLVCGGGAYELRRREQVRVEIATGREAERRADADAIASLEKSVASLKSKLADAEATIRYEEGRYEEVKRKHERAVRAAEETEGKWLLDQRELEHCRVTRKELDEELTSVKSRNDEVEEEVGWCRERLASTERAVEGMERALKKSREEKSSAVVPSFADIAKEIDAADEKGVVANVDGAGDKTAAADGEGKKKAAKKHKPVQMEMKYNKSFRNAVILRQVYSAVGGMVASALFPGIATVFRLIFMR